MMFFEEALTAGPFIILDSHCPEELQVMISVVLKDLWLQALVCKMGLVFPSEVWGFDGD